MLDGKTKVYGVIGDPIEHTLSPFIHNKIMEKLKENKTYVPYHVERNQLGDAIKGAWSLKIDGLNVTVPHKETVRQHLIGMDDFASQVGAVNTLKYTKEGYYGYNTDVYGLGRSLEVNDIELKGSNVLLIGAGGAARAAAVLCASKGVKKLMIMNRTLSKAEELACMVKTYYEVDVEIYPLSVKPLAKRIDVAIQTTSIGMHPYEDQMVITEDLCAKIQVAVDIIYNPKETLFLKVAKKKGAKVVNGLEMLFYQGIKAFEIWAEEELPRDLQKNLLEELKEYLERRL